MLSGLPDAAAHLLYYFGNLGGQYTIRLQAMIDDVPSAKRVFAREVEMAKGFTETLDNGIHRITSGSVSPGYNLKTENWNWYYAVGGYSAWGKGTAEVYGDCYTLEMEYKVFDRYNWDAGKFVKILGQEVTDEFMGTFHKQGLAQEFDMNGSVKKTIKWRKGEAPTITDGWKSGQGDR